MASGAVAAMNGAPGRSAVDRVVAVLLLALMAVGSFALWLLVPTAVLWGLGHLTISPSHHLVLALLAVPPAMVVFGALLVALNGLYLRVVGAQHMIEEETGELRPVRGPLEPMLGWSLAVAVVVGVVWLFLHPIPQLSGGIG